MHICSAKNWALGKKALQSSTLNNHKASRAVDGSRTAHRLHQNSCAQTNEEKRPWWTVNFGKVIHVQKVVIYNVDNCNGELSISIYINYFSISK